jgi:Ferritin-like domain
VRRRNRKQDPIAISEAELTQMTRDLDDAHHEALPSMRDSLTEWSESSDDIRSGLTHLVSTPSSRRAFLIGGGAVLGGFALVGSGVGSGLAAAATGRSAGVPAAQSAQKLSGDLAVVALAASLENLAVGTYQAAIDAVTQGKLTGVPDAVVTFAMTAQSQHKDHAAAWNAVLTGAGKQSVSGVDLTVKKGVDKAFAKVADVPGLATLALDLENVAAATYVAAIGVVKAPAGIKTAASIQPVEMQHAAILNFLLGQYPVPDAFAKSTGARPATDKIG